jgi:DNA-binding NarL/FixJ family response regulator
MQKILVVDDHEMFCESLSLALGNRLRSAEIEVAATGREAIRRFQEGAEFDLVLLDLGLSDMPGKTVFARMREMRPDQVIAILSATHHPGDLEWALEYGLNGFIPKSFRLDVLTAIVKLIEVEGRYFPELVSLGDRALMAGSHGRRPRQGGASNGNGHRSGPMVALGAAPGLGHGPGHGGTANGNGGNGLTHRADHGNGHGIANGRMNGVAQGQMDGAEIALAAGLTARQTEIIMLVAAGMSNKEIGRELAVLEGTIKAHLKTIMAKMNVKNRTQIAIKARMAGLV